MIAGITIAVISFFPGFHLMVKYANPALDAAALHPGYRLC